MIQSALQLVNLADNPVFHRFRRSQLRLRRSLIWYLLTVIVTTFVVSLTYIVATNSGVSAERIARILWFVLLIIQGLILLIKGTGKTSAGLIQDKIDQTLDYQRLTPVSPLRNVVGYLFGLPLLEYAMFALTLPHLAFIVIKGNIPLDSLLRVYLAFFVCAIFYHMTAISVGMVMRRWIWGYLLSIFAVVFLNLILPTFISQLGLTFLRYLSIWPVIGQEILPLLPLSFSNPFFLSLSDDVPFFNSSLSPFTFTLMLQGGLIATCATMAVRRWKKDTKHSLSKTYALGVLAAFVVLVTGTLWPIITGQSMPFSIFFGPQNINALSEGIAVGLPIVYSLAVWALCLFLFGIVVPTHHSYVRGVRRAVKLNRKAALPWDDDSANLPFMALFVAVAVAGYWILFAQLSNAGFYDFLEDGYAAFWRLPVVLALVLMYSLLLLQVLQARLAALTVLLLWFLPMLVAIVLGASMLVFSSIQTVIGSLSPIALLVASGLLQFASVVPAEGNSELRIMMTGFYTGLAFLVMQLIFLSTRWHGLRQKLH